MDYWMTTHWPHRTDHQDGVHENIYLPDGREDAGADLQPGDMVLIFESRTGRTEIRRHPDGRTEEVPCRTGKKGIVAVAEVASELEEIPGSSLEEYTDGTKIWWRWAARTRNSFTNGFVPAEEANRLLGYAQNYTFRAFGDRKSGLKKLTAHQYEQLLEAFNGNPVRKPISKGGEPLRPGHPYGAGGGEGDEHRVLKEYVAVNPDLVLTDSGASTIRTEYCFQTGDRADVVLRDNIGRIIGVEIEVSQPDGARDGVLQAIKYRFMLALMFGQRFPESRSLLVAYSIADSVK